MGFFSHASETLTKTTGPFRGLRVERPFWSSGVHDSMTTTRICTLGIPQAARSWTFRLEVLNRRDALNRDVIVTLTGEGP